MALLTAVSMLRASGALEALTRLCAPVLAWLGIPPETAMLLLVRPISGSGALAAASDIIQTYGADSRIGRTAAVMLGSTETTFYVLAVYFGCMRHPAQPLGDPRRHRRRRDRLCHGRGAGALSLGYIGGRQSAQKQTARLIFS